MRFMVLVLILAVSSPAGARLIFDDYNEIGIYTDPSPTRANAQELSTYAGPPGPFAVYVVCTLPYNTVADAPITSIGGFGFTLRLPANVFLTSATFPPGGSNLATIPGFRCVGLDLPVVQRRATLLTLTLLELYGEPGYIYFSSTPHVLDHNDGDASFPGYPTSGHYTRPVFGIYQAVVPVEAAAWGSVKNLYR